MFQGFTSKRVTMTSAYWEKECSEVVGALAGAGKCLVGVESAELGEVDRQGTLRTLD